MLLLASFLFLLNKGKSFELIIPDGVDGVEDVVVTRGSSDISIVLVESGEGLNSLDPFEDISRLCNSDVFTSDL